MSNIQENLFKTIEAITDNKLNKIKFDKTVQALIEDDSKGDSGEYQVRYQDIIFKAFSSSNTSKYKNGENVLVLIPDGDMGNRKTIVSSQKQEGEKYVDVDKIVDRVGINYVDEPKGFEIGLSTTSDEQVSFKIRERDMIDMYPGKRFLCIGAEIYTNINEEDREGEYGIALDCEFEDKEGGRHTKRLSFTTFNVTGNPYEARGYKEVKIPLFQERLVKVTSARAYSKGFTKGNEKIRFKNIVVEYVDIRDEDPSEYIGNILTPNGTHFRSSTLYPDESLNLVMEFKQKGEVLKSKEIVYKWFVLNPSIDSTEDPGYDVDGGMGWERILDSNYNSSLIKGSATDTLSVYAGFVPSYSSIKCVAYYPKIKTMVSDMVSLVDHTDEIKTEIISDNGISFINGVGKTTLTAVVTAKGKQIPKEGIRHRWSKKKANGEIELIEENGNSSIVVEGKSVDKKTVITCETIKKGMSRPISTGQITLVNLLEGRSHGINIIGGFRAVLYDGEGKISPSFENEPFMFEVYSNGEKVTSNIDWVWKIPQAKKTMLSIQGDKVDEAGYQTSKTKNLTLIPDNNFSIEKSKNEVLIEAKYVENGVSVVLKDMITISVAKVGQNGADGAAGTAGLDGKTYVYQIMGGSKTLTYNKNGENPSPKTIPQFSLMFSVDGDNQLAKEVEQVIWRLEKKDKSVLGFKGKEKSVREITTRKTNGNSNVHIIELVSDEVFSEEKYANILTAEISYKGRTYWETYPISVIKNGSDGLSGLSIDTLPNSYVIDSLADGNVQQEVTVEVGFEIYREETKIEDFFVSSIENVPPGMECENKGDRIKVKFLKGNSLPNHGYIKINLDAEGRKGAQTFAFSKSKSGQSPYSLILQSTNGIVFRRGDISTIIYALVMQGSTMLTDSLPESSFRWEKIDKSGNKVEGWTPNLLDGQGDKIIVTPKDIEEKATFNCYLTI